MLILQMLHVTLARMTSQMLTTVTSCTTLLMSQPHLHPSLPRPVTPVHFLHWDIPQQHHLQPHPNLQALTNYLHLL